MKLVASVTGMAGLTAGGLLTAAPAQAGTNGQHVEVCDSVTFAYFSLRGTNQSGQHRSTGWRNTGPNTNCWEFTNYWWKGNISVWSGGPNSFDHNFVYHSIKSYLPSTNWYTCYTSAATCIKG